MDDDDGGPSYSYILPGMPIRKKMDVEPSSEIPHDPMNIDGEPSSSEIPHDQMNINGGPVYLNQNPFLFN